MKNLLNNLPDIPGAEAFKSWPEVPGSRLAKAPFVYWVPLFYAVIVYVAYATLIFKAKVLGFEMDVPVGGDYLAFYGASEALAKGQASEIYNVGFFENLLQELYPRDNAEDYGLTWQYPPTLFLVIWPLAYLPGILGYVLWMSATLALMLFVLKKLFGLEKAGLFLIALSPVVYTTNICGQNAFLTASLLFLAACLSDRKPVIAGLAAGLLTIKPQLGVLLPFAFLAAGHWRAFLTAGVTTLALIGVSVLMLGLEPWYAFFDAIRGVGEGVAAAKYPLQKMPTLFAVLKTAGLPATAAMAGQIAGALAAIAVVAWVWRRETDWAWRAAVLCACVFLCTPYGYIYEMNLLLLPMMVVVMAAFKTGWLKYEEHLVLLVYFLSMILLQFWREAGPFLPFGTLALVLFITFRRYAQRLPD